MAKSFDAVPKEDLLKAMKDYYQKDLGGAVSDVEGTFVGDSLSACAVESEAAHAEMNLIIQAAFAQTGWGDYLTMRAAEFGVDRKLATRSVGIVTVKGNGLVPKGAIFATKSGIQFSTTKAVKIEDSGEVPVEAVVAGTEGNVKAGTIVSIPVTIAGIGSVVNEADMAEGYDEETDEALRDRLFFHVRNPITSGNMNHYRQWAESVEGVGAARTIPLWKGNGTVKVLIVNDKQDKASEDLIKKTGDYIETVRPIGASVTVATPDYMDIDIKCRVKPAEGHESSYAEELKAAINQYLVAYGFEGELANVTYVSIARIGEAMIHSGAITDYDSLQVNGGITGVTLNQESLPRVKSLEVTLIE